MKGNSYATFLYSESDQTKKKRHLRGFLKDIFMSRDIVWFILWRLFNEIINNSDKARGPARAKWSFVDLRSFIFECELFDLKHLGDPRSWRGSDTLILWDADWIDPWPILLGLRCFPLEEHSTCILKDQTIDHSAPPLQKKGIKKKRWLFRYDRRLKNNLEVKELVRECWIKDRWLPIR